MTTDTYTQPEARSARSCEDKARTRIEYVADGKSRVTKVSCGIFAPVDAGGTDTFVSGPSTIAIFCHQSERWMLKTPGLSSATLQLVDFHVHERDKDVDPGDGEAIRSLGAGKVDPGEWLPPAIPTGQAEQSACAEGCDLSAMMQFVAGDKIPQPTSLHAFEDTASSDPRVLKSKEIWASPPLSDISVIFCMVFRNS